MSTVQVQAKNVPREFSKINFESDCRGFDTQINKCEDVPQGENVEFYTNILLNKCLDQPKKFYISPVGINQVSMYTAGQKI